MIRSGARRLLAVAAVLLAAAVMAALLAVALGSGVERSLALGCYLVGSLAGFLGFALGSRGLFRGRRHADGEDAGHDTAESQAVAAVLMICGVALVLLGITIDPRAELA